MTSNIAKKRYPQTHKPTDFLNYCSPSAAALGEENGKKGVLIKEISPKPLNMQSFGHHTFISSQDAGGTN